MKVKDLVRTDYEVVAPEVEVSQVKGRFAKDPFLVVMDRGRFMGILTSSSAAVRGDGPAGDCIDAHPPVDCDSDIRAVGGTMSGGRFSVLPVFEKDAFVGVVSQTDIVDSLLKVCGNLEQEMAERRERLLVSNRDLRQSGETPHGAEETVGEAGESRSDLLAEVSHEIKNPLHIILSYSRNGIKKFRTAEREKLKRYFSLIEYCGNKLMLLVNDLQDLSRLETGNISYNFAEEKLSDCVELSISEFGAIMENRQISVDFQRPAFSDVVTMDKNRILQVIRNLLSNAEKFSPDRSIIRIEIARREADLMVSVKDWGSGISEEDLERVFDKFSRGIRSNRNTRGEGLGLCVVKRIVSEHQGAVWAEPNPEGGVVFNFTLPFNQE
ncbi:MAG: CBS domain-containing protein [Proteobacteria bacterium]|nr:CBS domain-containing protein [Pseudomonadota bacterium]